MASNRHLGRIIALQTLYEQEFRNDAGDTSFDTDEILRRNIGRYEALVDDVAFIEQLVHGVLARQTQLDTMLQPIAPEWPIDQIARMDRIVLRIGLYELEQTADVPPKVVINEAIELAKAFGSENSSKFINGVLGTALRNMTESTPGRPADSNGAKPKAKTAKKTPETTDSKPKSAKPKPKTTKKVTTKPKKTQAQNKKA